MCSRVSSELLADGELDLQQKNGRCSSSCWRRRIRSSAGARSDLTDASCGPATRHCDSLPSTGTRLNSRRGVVADWPRIFAEAAKRRVAIEIDGNWHRQDVPFDLAAQALDAGCLFALDSDAHSIGELRFTDYSIAHARIAGIPASRVINCWSDERSMVG